MVTARPAPVNARTSPLYWPAWRETGLNFEPTTTRLWKRLSREERLTAAHAFFKETSPELLAGAMGAIVKARHLRPQVARALGEDERARALAAIHEPGETVAASLLVSLHLSARRPMLAAFLDALQLPHEDGVMKEEADAAPPVSAEAARGALGTLLEEFPQPEVETYLNTLWLQDPERWTALAQL